MEKRRERGRGKKGREDSKREGWKNSIAPYCLVINRPLLLVQVSLSSNILPLLWLLSSTVPPITNNKLITQGLKERKEKQFVILPTHTISTGVNHNLNDRPLPFFPSNQITEINPAHWRLEIGFRDYKEIKQCMYRSAQADWGNKHNILFCLGGRIQRQAERQPNITLRH